MIFQIFHRTTYQYATPASESYGELRVCPMDSPSLQVRKRKLRIRPTTRIRFYDDLFGNRVEFFSIPRRHDSLTVEASAEVETRPVAIPEAAATISVAEARQILGSRALDHYFFLQPTRLVPLNSVLKPLKEDFLPRDKPLDAALVDANLWVYENFTYQPGVTDISTPLREVVKTRSGVCQDFAHLLLSILRTYQLPARYVSGYIEATDPDSRESNLVGAIASHAWVEVQIPGGAWIGLDPTNNQVAGERHVRLAVGRDYTDAAPLKGTYKGASDQKLQVIVSVKRRKQK